MTENEMVRDFHLKFDLPTGREDVLTGDNGNFVFRSQFLIEEIEEFCRDWGANDRVKMLDALIDLVYVAHGTALMMGVTPDQWKAAFIAVHQANMRKVRATSADQSARKSTLDVVKPAGWVGPEETLREILKA